MHCALTVRHALPIGGFVLIFLALDGLVAMNWQIMSCNSLSFSTTVRVSLHSPVSGYNYVLLYLSVTEQAHDGQVHDGCAHHGSHCTPAHPW